MKNVYFQILKVEDKADLSEVELELAAKIWESLYQDAISNAVYDMKANLEFFFTNPHKIK